MRRTSVAVLLTVGLMTALAGEVSAAGKGKGGGGKGGGGKAGTGGPAATSPSVSPQAQQDLQAAQVEVQKTDAALLSVKQALRKEFEATPDYQAALDAVKAAQAEYEAARRPVIAALAQQPEYQAARAARNKAQSARDLVVADPSATFEDRTAAVTAAIDAGTALTALEDKAAAADPACVAAKAKLTAATQKLADLLKQFEASLPNNAQWQPAKAASDAAKQKLEDARKALTGH